MKNQFLTFTFVISSITLLSSCKEPKGHCDAYSCNDKHSKIHHNEDIENVDIKNTSLDNHQ